MYLSSLQISGNPASREDCAPNTFVSRRPTLLGIFQEALAANDQLLSVGEDQPIAQLQKAVSESVSHSTQERNCTRLL